jgi:hypothetical protein
MRFKNRYRVVRDGVAGFEAQWRPWWWPFWIQLNGVNTSRSLDAALEIVKTHRDHVVWTDSRGRFGDSAVVEAARNVLLKGKRK